MSVDFYFIRHGESDKNITPEIIGGRSNRSILTPKGISQAKALSERFKKENITFTKVYSSPATRAMHTCFQSLTVLSENKKFEVVDDLQELSQGEWEGKIRTEVYTPQVLEEMRERHQFFTAPGGESQFMVENRMVKWLVKTQNEIREGKIAVFTHGNAIKCLLRNILDFNAKLTWRLEIENTSITQIRYTDDGIWLPIRINDFGHLSGIE